jgi:hypothetical protein
LSLRGVASEIRHNALEDMVYSCLKEMRNKPLARAGDFVLETPRRFEDETQRRF